MQGFQSRSIFKNAYRSDIVRLILICGGLFVLLWFIEITFLMTADGTDFFYQYFKNPYLLPLELEKFTSQPWSLLSYGFLDTGFWTLFTNMIWLWIFGTVLEDLRGTNRVLPIFWVGFIFAGVILLVVNYFTQWSSGLYMSTLAGVSAVGAATLTYKPRYTFYAIFNKGVPIYVFGLLFVVLTIYIQWNDNNALVMFLGGSLLGILSQNLFYNFFERTRNVLAKTRSFFSSNENFIKQPKERKLSSVDKTNLDMDTILDKINASGMESLSNDEKKYLNRYKN